MDLSELMFELSNQRRVEVLKSVSKKSIKVTEVAESLKMSHSEISRHISRLMDAKLIDKNSDGSYSLTTVGKMITSYLPEFSFIAKNVDFFLNHDVSYLPREFRRRLGELKMANIIEKTLKAVEESINLFKMAEEFVWAMSSEVMEEPGEILNLKLQENPIFGWRRIFLREIIENPENERVLDKIHTTVLINEKMAILFLPYLHGKTDFSKAFVSDDEKFYNWCRDLFLYYWKKAKI